MANFVYPVASSGGAAVDLSNLTSPTAINQDLLFAAPNKNIGDTTNYLYDINTAFVTSSGSSGLQLRSNIGEVSIAPANDILSIYSITASTPTIKFWDTTSNNNIGLTTVNTLGADFTLNLPIVSGTLVASTNGQGTGVASVSTSLTSGNTEDMASGIVTVASGDSGTGVTGIVSIRSGSTSDNGITGDVNVGTGDADANSGTTASGNINLVTGTSGTIRGSITLDALTVSTNEFSSGNLGPLVPDTWGVDIPGIMIDGTTAAAVTANGAGIVYKGDLNFMITTQDLSTAHQGAAIYMATGAQTNAGNYPSGSFTTATGASSNGSSGENIVTTGTGQYSGAVSLFTGNSVIDSGQIMLNTGTAGTNRGNIILRAPLVEMPTAAANPSNVSTGVMYFYSSGGTYELRAYLNGGWRSVILT